MTVLLLAAAFLPAAAGAEEIILSTPAVHARQPDRQLPQKYSPALRQVMKDLSILLDRGGEIPAEKMDALAAEIGKFDGKVKDALGPDILANEAGRQDAELAEAAKQTLASFRAALQVYYAENGGKYPADPSKLPPETLPAVPQLRLPAHAPSSALTVIDSKKYDNGIAKAVTDSGGWLYFSNPGSGNYGLLVIDCSHRVPGGEEFYKY